MNVEYVHCPICEVEATSLWLDDGKATRYVRCHNCETVFASPRASRESRLDWINSSFQVSDRVHDLTRLRKPALQQEARLLRREAPGGKLLDVGCSTGALFEFFSAPEWERYGVELSPSTADYARRTYAAKVHTGTLKSASYDSKTFDLVTVIDTFYYIDDPVAELQEIARILKPGGKLALEIAGQAYILWRTFGWAPLVLDGRRARTGTDSSYIFWYSPVGLERLLKKCGFRALAWHVIPSPVNTGMAGLLMQAHYSTMKALYPIARKSLTLAPKYLCIAEPIQG